MKKLIITLILAVFCQESFAGDEKVVVSIKPLHSLVQSVMGESSKAYLLMNNNSSPHNFRL